MSKINYKKRQQRVRRKLKKVSFNRFRLSVFKSAKNISAQIIDDTNHKTLIEASSLKEKKPNEKKKKSDMSVHVAGLLAKKALEKKITQVYFDRGRYRYHGRIKIFADPNDFATMSFIPTTSQAALIGPPAIIPVPEGADLNNTLPAPSLPKTS
jgi:large subunit ribosomal protein L18